MDFESLFQVLTGYPPFPWQERLYRDWFAQGKIPPPCNLPTGLGKTNVIAVWLIGLINHPNRVPRRLIYVVNRRTVVDQTTNEVEKLRTNLLTLPDLPEHANNLAISTLRGQFADNREWSSDPSRPAVICGTVDMIGSRLLFSGYGIGFKGKPLHAGFLGQDALLVHDEAHLEPAFQRLIETIGREQERCEEFSKLRVMELTATRRSDGGQNTKTFVLTDEDAANSIVKQRIEARKQLRLTAVPDDKHVANEVAKIAATYKDAKAAILVFARTVDDVNTIAKELEKTKRRVVLLTGTLRGKERDDLVETAEFKRFLKGAPPAETVYLVCTSAGEVGIDISADHMVCDLSTFDSMAQRFGRVNRYGEGEARIDVVYPEKLEEKHKLTPARMATLALLRKLDGDASPLNLRSLDAAECQAAFTPPPTMLDATDILFDFWAMTSIREKLPGRPPVEPYLHGIAEWQPSETQIAWREEVGVICNEDLLERYPPQDLLDDFPLKPHETLRDQSDRVFAHLQTIRDRVENEVPVWIIDESGEVIPTSLGSLFCSGRHPQLQPVEIKKAVIARISNATILLPPSAGGLRDGMLNGEFESADDVSDDLRDGDQLTQRWRGWDDDAPPKGMRLIRAPIDTAPDADEGESEQSNGRRFWYWYTRPRSADGDLSKCAAEPIRWQHHTDDVVCHVTRIADALRLPADLRQALILAARFHDLGKRREVWQRSIGNPNPSDWHAKSGRDRATGKLWKPRDLCPNYRHEFGSLLDVSGEVEFQQLSDDLKDLVLHLIAAHHGRARPHFPAVEAFDPERNGPYSASLAIDVPCCFARMQRKYGRWGLAYLESLLRAADYAASAEPSEVAP